MPEDIKLAEYIFTRIFQLGVRAVHGVPGDYNLTLLDYVEPAGLDWVGNCNELNAGYAADGYARVKGIGALITTFGVGELSAINAIAGAYCEFAPVLHIVGTPMLPLQQAGTMIHHTLGDGSYEHFAAMVAPVVVAQVNLTDAAQAPEQFDWAVEQCLANSRPVYIRIPVDMVDARVSSARLSNSIAVPRAPTNPETLNMATEQILKRVYDSKSPFILVDGETLPAGITEEVNEFVRLTGFPTGCSAYGKSRVKESLPNFHGVIHGIAAKIDLMPFIKESDLVIVFGPHYSNTNTYLFTTIPDSKKTIAVCQKTVEIGLQSSDDTPLRLQVSPKTLMENILKEMNKEKLPKYNPYPSIATPRSLVDSLPPTDKSAIIDQDTFYLRLSPYIREGDFILGETGTASYGIRDVALPDNTMSFGHVTWLSIGYMLGATQGMAIAQKELLAAGKPQGRTILVIGDGSLQMSAQEISTIIRKKLDVIIFVLNNDGYTIERCIHGWKAHYNDVAAWRYLEAPSFFGADKEGEYAPQVYHATNWGELEEVWAKKELWDAKGLRMVEVKMDMEDGPAPMLAMTRKYNKKKLPVD